jgi:uncharacterized membrane protein YbhN (UPF0104 family)
MCMAVGALVLHADARDPQTAGMVVGVALLFVALVITLQNARVAGLASRLLRLVGLARYQPKLHGMVASLQRYRGHRPALLQAFALSLALQSLIIVVYYLVGQSLGTGVSLGYFFLYVPLITTLAMLPISVAGLGVREGGVVYFFAKVGVDGSTALGMSLIWFALSASVSALGGLALLVDLHLRKREPE